MFLPRTSAHHRAPSLSVCSVYRTDFTHFCSVYRTDFDPLHAETTRIALSNRNRVRFTQSRTTHCRPQTIPLAGIFVCGRFNAQASTRANMFNLLTWENSSRLSVRTGLATLKHPQTQIRNTRQPTRRRVAHFGTQNGPFRLETFLFARGLGEWDVSKRKGPLVEGSWFSRVAMPPGRGQPAAWPLS